MANAFTGAATTAATMVCENISGKSDYTFGEIVQSSIVDGAASFAAGKIVDSAKLNSVETKSRNRLLKSTREIMKNETSKVKVVHKIIKTSSCINATGKLMACAITKGLPLDLYYGVKQRIQIKQKLALLD